MLIFLSFRRVLVHLSEPTVRTWEYNASVVAFYYDEVVAAVPLARQHAYVSMSSDRRSEKLDKNIGEEKQGMSVFDLHGVHNTYRGVRRRLIKLPQLFQLVVRVAGVPPQV